MAFPKTSSHIKLVVLSGFSFLMDRVHGFPSFTKNNITTDADFPSSVVAVDLNGDGDVDVLSASSRDDTIAWYENDGNLPPGFTKHNIATDANGANSVFAIDVDGDGDVDVLSASFLDDTIAWYENLGGLPLGFAKHNITTDASGAVSVFAVDLDGDGDVDVLSAHDDTIAWYENDGNSLPGFTKHTIVADAHEASSVYAVDVDGDGDVDVLSASFLDDTIAWYENLGGSPLVFTKHIIASDADEARSVYAVDVDGDGDVDVLSASQNDGTIAWYENDGKSHPGFTKHNITTDADEARSLYAVDLDGDRDVDVLSASRGNDPIAWYENCGGSPLDFTKHTINTDAKGARSVFAMDLDGDGEVDVLFASGSDDTVAWYKNFPPTTASPTASPTLAPTVTPTSYGLLVQLQVFAPSLACSLVFFLLL